MIYPVGFTTVSATGVIKASAGSLTSITISGAGDAATVTLHDNASAGSGVVVHVAKAGAGATTSINLTHPLAFSNGLYATITGTAPSITVGYF